MRYLKRNNFTLYFILTLVLQVFITLTGCGENKNESNIDNEITQWNTNEYVYDITEMDRLTDYSYDEVIELEGLISSRYIYSGGNYLLTGSGTQPVIIDAEEQIVHLILCDAVINVSRGPAIYVKSSGKTIITLAEGTTNVLIDGAYDNYGLDADSALYSESDLSINGSGIFWVYAYREAAIKSKDMMKILDGNINIVSKGDGIRGNDGVLIAGGDISIECEGNGIISTKAKKGLSGSIEIYNTNVNIVAGKYGIESKLDVYIKNCNVVNKGILGDLKYEGKAYIEEGKYSTN